MRMAALYDGDDNRVFTASRTEDTKSYQLFAPKKDADDKGTDGTGGVKKASPKTSAQGAEGSIFWYGFGQSFIEHLPLRKIHWGRCGRRPGNT